MAATDGLMSCNPLICIGGQEKGGSNGPLTCGYPFVEASEWQGRRPSQPAFSRNRIFEMAFWTHFHWFCRAHKKIFAHFCTLWALASCWKAVLYKKKGSFLLDTLERVLKVSIIWYILSKTLLSTCKCGYYFLIMETLQHTLINSWKGCHCKTPCWSTLSRKFKSRQCLPIMYTLPDRLRMHWKCQQYGTPL